VSAAQLVQIPSRPNKGCEVCSTEFGGPDVQDEFAHDWHSLNPPVETGPDTVPEQRLLASGDVHLTKGA
jgi:hypothetical protein